MRACVRATKGKTRGGENVVVRRRRETTVEEEEEEEESCKRRRRRRRRKGGGGGGKMWSSVLLKRRPRLLVFRFPPPDFGINYARAYRTYASRYAAWEPNEYVNTVGQRSGRAGTAACNTGMTAPKSRGTSRNGNN